MPDPLPPPSQVSLVFDGGRPEGPAVPEPVPLRIEPREAEAVATVEAADSVLPLPPVPPVPSVPAVPAVPAVPPVPAVPAQAPLRAVAPKPPAFPPPTNFSLSPQLVPPQPRPRGSIDLSLGPAIRGALDLSPMSERGGRSPGPDWRNELSAWVRQHAYYPPQAASQGEQGSAKVRVTVNPSGRVTSVELVGRSGSIWLDMALQVLFRDRMLPRMSSGVTEPVTFDFTMRYIIVR